MRKFSLLYISLMILLLSGCAVDSRVNTFYEIGCSSSFSDIFLTKGTNTSTTYPLKVIMGLNCNEDVSVTIKFYDNGYPGHYKYFLVDGVSGSYEDKIYTTSSGISSGLYTFTTDDTLYTKGAYYGIYEVKAKNLETDDYTIQQYRIEAYDYHSINNKEPAESNFKANPVPPLLDADNTTFSDNTAVDNITDTLTSQDNQTK